MTSHDLRVLLVEDSRLLSDRLLELISGIEGVTSVGAVVTEADAIVAVSTAHPDVVLLDLRLKEGTGFGVLRQLLPMKSPPLVVVITNYALPQYRREAEALGARHFLDKTQEFDQIPALLKSLKQELNAYH